MKKTLCILFSLFLLLAAFGCASAKKDIAVNDTGIWENEPVNVTTIVPTMPPETSEPVSEATSEATTEATTTTSSTTTTVTTTTVAMTTTAAMTMAPAAEDKVLADGVKTPEATVAMPLPPTPGEKPEVQVGAGMLTAGEWKDLDDIPFWTKLLNDNDWYKLMESRALFANKIVPVKVTDRNGNPCFNVPVILKDTDSKEVYKAMTDVNGMAYLLYALDNSKQEAKCVNVDGTDYDIVKNGETVIAIDSAAVGVKQLDLLFMIDTTGSMSDELTYLQAELRDVIRKVAQSGEAFAINLSVNFYRDTGDEYVVRSFEFTNDIDKAISQLSEQRAAGGGDYAEAVHLALEDVVNNHQWRDDSVKLCFMVLDAPPHTDREIKGIDNRMQTTVMSMAETGIRFIPIASSGVDTETEFLLRSWAVMTGGTYTFLTNHSGIGNSHLEPTIGEYEVEKLNDLLVRVISEYCGMRKQ